MERTSAIGKGGKWKGRASSPADTGLLKSTSTSPIKTRRRRARRLPGTPHTSTLPPSCDDISTPHQTRKRFIRKAQTIVRRTTSRKSSKTPLDGRSCAHPPCVRQVDTDAELESDDADELVPDPEFPPAFGGRSSLLMVRYFPGMYFATHISANIDAVICFR